LKHTIHIIVLLFFCPLIAAAQPYYVKGLVKDEEGSPLQNVTMQLHSSGYLYHTGKDGGFGIVIPAKTDTLIFIRDGYENEKRAIYANAFNEIILKKTPVLKTPVLNRLSSLVQNVPADETPLSTAGNEMLLPGLPRPLR
jgi:hypothetical protein